MLHAQLTHIEMLYTRHCGGYFYAIAEEIVLSSVSRANGLALKIDVEVCQFLFVLLNCFVGRTTCFVRNLLA